MSKTHYEVLGVARGAKDAEIRSAFRRIVLKHHPDRSRDPKSKAIFLAATESYEVLKDPEARRGYDAELAFIDERRRKAEEAKRAAATAQPTSRPRVAPTAPVVPISVEVTKLSIKFNSGNYAEAEKLAHRILQRDPRQAVPYAVLGDIARSRGNINEAQQMFSMAIQMDPQNSLYQRRYEQLLEATSVKVSGIRASLVGANAVPATPAIAAGVAGVAAIYLAASGESQVFRMMPLITSWTIGLLLLLFLCGIVTGACLSLGNWLERFDVASTTSTGKMGPSVALGMVALVSFPCAALVYALVGLVQRSHNYTTTRLVAGVVCTVAILGVGASFNETAFSSVALWGGNLCYLGALLGWMVADAMRPTGA